MSDVMTHYRLTHWGRVTHIYVSKLAIIGSDNGLSPGRRQAIIWTNAGILSIGPLETNFSEIYIQIRTFSFMKMGLKVSSVKWRLFCLGLNVLNVASGCFYLQFVLSYSTNIYLNILIRLMISSDVRMHMQSKIFQATKNERKILNSLYNGYGQNCWENSIESD